jgi:mono/diheme cytochrome c family protein
MKPAVLLIIFLLSLTACDRTNNDPGFDYFPDMFYSKAYETNSENPNFADGKTMREPVKGTVPLGMIPYPYEKNDADRALAGIELVNPLPVNDENMKRGEAAYKIFCVNCHGINAGGNGQLYTSGLYAFKPASLVNEKMTNAPDGEFYHVITVGQGVMMAHGSQIRLDDRWKIVMYKSLGIRIRINDENGKSHLAEFICYA